MSIPVVIARAPITMRMSGKLNIPASIAQSPLPTTERTIASKVLAQAGNPLIFVMFTYFLQQGPIIFPALIGVIKHITPGSRAGFEQRSSEKSVAVQSIVIGRCPTTHIFLFQDQNLTDKEKGQCSRGTSSPLLQFCLSYKVWRELSRISQAAKRPRY